MSYTLKLLLVLWCLIFAFSETPGKIEANLIPVVGEFEYIIEDDATGKYESNIYLSFMKLRDECSFSKIEFSLYEEKDGTVQMPRIKSVYLGEEKARYIGKHFAGPWSVNATVEQLKNINIKVYHSCHFAFDTITTYEIRNGKVI